jgi:hypothetical protein
MASCGLKDNESKYIPLMVAHTVPLFADMLSQLDEESLDCSLPVCHKVVSWIETVHAAIIQHQGVACHACHATKKELEENAPEETATYDAVCKHCDRKLRWRHVVLSYEPPPAPFPVPSYLAPFLASLPTADALSLLYELHFLGGPPACDVLAHYIVCAMSDDIV